MKWIGLTGGIATGKSTVSRLLNGLGVSVIDADRIAREVTEKSGPAYASILQNFGPGVVDQDGHIDRRKLGRIVFNDPPKRKQLESIIHPLVQEEVKRQRQWLQDQGVEMAIYDVPLLFEKALQNQFDSVILVTSTNEQQRSRMASRDHLSEEEISERLAAQIPLSDKEKLATYVIRNDGTMGELEEKVKQLIKQISEE